MRECWHSTAIRSEFVRFKSWEKQKMCTSPTKQHEQVRCSHFYFFFAAMAAIIMKMTLVNFIIHSKTDFSLFAFFCLSVSCGRALFFSCVAPTIHPTPSHGIRDGPPVSTMLCLAAFLRKRTHKCLTLSVIRLLYDFVRSWSNLMTPTTTTTIQQTTRQFSEIKK